jgi:tetratricopeptide (TPR) repeat protein
MPETHLNLAYVLAGHASRLSRQNRYDEAEALLEEAVEIGTKQLSAAHWQVMRFRGLIRNLFRAREQWDRLEASLREEIMIQAAVPEGETDLSLRARFELAKLLADRGNLAEAAPMLEAMRAISPKLLSENDSQHADEALLLGRCLLGLERPADALAPLETAHAHATRYRRPETAAEAAAALAEVCETLGRGEDAARWRAAAATQSATP